MGIVAAMVAATPSGVVSFLFTDVEGSTKLWDADSDAMAASLQLHDQIMREEIDAHGGHVFSTAGDAFAVAFGRDEDAVSASTAIQLRLLAADWPGPAIKVRMGIHTGTAEERDGDYFGPVLNRAARIMSAGHGGQIPPFSYEILEPTVQLAGDSAVFSFNLRMNDPKSGEQFAVWNTTEVHRRRHDGWELIHAHWSYAVPPAED